MKFIPAFLVAAAALMQPTVVLAENTPSLVSLGLKCSDFQKKDDGTWSATHMLTIPAGGARMSVSPKDILGPTTSIAGQPLGTMVNIECDKPAK